ncbi:Hpt domain-containing protein [Ruminococcus albus]|uniref:Hpt domain-containing protein n=1 Tax=Ruminococcus albus TaxID=1264 RepID=A0A1I1EC82_RUMAL|nr:Hpt domain-containing protein [Ruminococcus albus]SFB84769.1 hypothetical protein SAMN02910406_00647 [Ruminococcus albus]
MTEKDRAELVKCGIDYADGLEKFMDEELLYCGLLVNFLTENTFEEAKRCMDSGDDEGVMRAVHSMKSVTGTLSMYELYTLCYDTVDALRGGDRESALDSFGRAYEVYKRTVECIKRVIVDGGLEYEKIQDDVS